MIKTKNVFAPFEESDGKRILIMRYYPSRRKSMEALHIDKWIRDLAPSKELLSDYNHKGLSPEEYTPRFKQEIQSNPKAQEIIKMLQKESRDGNVTLLCICKEGDFCHRLLVKEMIT